MSEEREIQDLDILRPRPQYVRLAGHDIDVSFIPSGIALDIIGMQGELQKLADTAEKIEEMKTGGETAKRSMEIATELCAALTRGQYPEMDKEWLLRNTNFAQIKALMEHVIKAVAASVGNAEDGDPKNPEAAEAQGP